MELSPDTIVYWRWGVLTLNATILNTWVVMAVLVAISYWATRNLSAGIPISRWQSVLETIVTLVGNQVQEIIGRRPDPYLPFIGTLFLFISVANFLSIIPGFRAPTGSLATTTALALAVFVAIPAFGIMQQGVWNYLKLYTQPTVIMLPLNIIGEFSRILALAVRLFGNIMSGDLIVAVLLSIIPLFFPLIMQLFGLLVGQIQAYIFAILATVYIGSALRSETSNPARGETTDVQGDD